MGVPRSRYGDCPQATGLVMHDLSGGFTLATEWVPTVTLKTIDRTTHVTKEDLRYVGFRLKKTIAAGTPVKVLGVLMHETSDGHEIRLLECDYQGARITIFESDLEAIA